MVLKQCDVVDFCLNEGWKPFFIAPSDEPLDAIKSHLQREISVAVADGQKKIVHQIISFLEKIQARDFAQELLSSVSFELEDCISNPRKLPRLPCSHERAQSFYWNLCSRGNCCPDSLIKPLALIWLNGVDVR